MYNQYSVFALDLYRQYFGFIAVRKRFKGRKDAFYNFNYDEESQADQQTLRRLSVTINKLSSMCFKECIFATGYKIYTTEQQSCVRECVQRYFKGYEQLTFYTNRKIVQQQ